MTAHPIQSASDHDHASPEGESDGRILPSEDSGHTVHKRLDGLRASDVMVSPEGLDAAPQVADEAPSDTIERASDKGQRAACVFEDNSFKEAVVKPDIVDLDSAVSERGGVVFHECGFLRADLDSRTMADGEGESISLPGAAA